MMPQQRYLECVSNIMEKIEERAKAGDNMISLTQGEDDYGIMDLDQWESIGTTQIGLVIKELKRLGFHVTEANPAGTELVVIW